MADNVNVSGPIEIKDNSRERVAFDLMNRIAHLEEGATKTKRDYWFTLYRQCWKATHGWDLESIQKQD